MLAVKSVKNEGYRPDIDGIRAIAVIAVILYHFNIPGFTGGFVGVDIFFAISGYLISKGIISNYDKGKFNFCDFYFRRTRRLIPALLVVISLTYVASYFIQSPKDFAQLSGSTVYALAGISNVYFWMQSGYFDNFSSLKPLLHTWSLSVELQFYIIWPFVLLLICKHLKQDRYRFIFVAILTMLLAAISIYQVNNDSSGAFYLTHYRMHEFTIGACAVFIEKYIKSNRFSCIAYVVGALMIVSPIFAYDVKKIVFPGYYALIPSLGAALMICTGAHTKLSSFLGARIPSYIGEVSYSLYLTHWPIFVMVSYVFVFPLTLLQTICTLFFTVILSLSLYYFVEKKFRSSKNKDLNGAAFSLACTMFAIVIIIPSSSSWAGNGWEWRLPKEMQQINNINISDTTDYTWKEQEWLAARSEFDKSSRKKILIIGDSQSADVINMMKESGAISKFDVIARTVYFDCGTPYVSKDDEDLYFKKLNALTIARPDLIPKCISQFDAALNNPLIKEADEIFIAFHYQPNLTEYVEKGIDKVRTLTNAKVYIFGKKGFSKSSVDIANSFNRIVGIEKYSSKFIVQSTLDINGTLKNYSGAEFVDVLKFICPENDKCSSLTDDMKPVLYDGAHFTRFGAKFIGDKIFNNNKVNSF